jgi:predicted RNase H-like HicB family nuclease
MIIEYIGLAEKVADGYSIFFPDFPGFGSAGHNLDEARKNTSEGLIAHIKLMLEDRETIPKPTSLDKIMKLPEAKGCIPLMIGIVAPSGKAQRVNITLDSELLNAIDKIAVHQHKTRSALLAEAAQKLLETFSYAVKPRALARRYK